MELIEILLLGSTFLCVSFEQSVTSEERYEVKIFRGITKVRSEGTLPYLEKYPDANTDKFSEETRRKHCQVGFDKLVQEEGKIFQFSENEKTGKLETYVLVTSSNSEDESDEDNDDDVQVLVAYQCPTVPPMYIHIHFEPLNGVEPSVWVIFEDSGPPFNFSHINLYYLHLVEEIREAYAEEISSKSNENNIGTSACNSDELSEEQRLRMCQRVMNMTPEIGAYFVDKIKSGMSKYYIIFESAGKESKNHPKLDEAEAETKAMEKILVDANQNSENESENSERDHRTSKGDSGIIQAFTCPTVPEIYVSVMQTGEEDYNLFATVKENGIKERPVFNLMGYELIIANFISKIHEETKTGVETGKDDEKESRFQTYLSTKEKSSRKWEENTKRSQSSPEESLDPSNLDDFIAQNDELRQMIDELEGSNRVLDTIRKELYGNDVSIETDEFTEEERRSICEKAMRTVLGRDAKFVNGDTGTGRSARYRYFVDQKDEYFISHGIYQTDKVVKAFTCHTQPVLYVRVARYDSENVHTAQVIVSGKDLALSLMEFK